MERKSPAVIILDRSFKTKKKLKIFTNKNRKISIFTQTNNRSKEKYFKKLGVNIIKLKKSTNLKNEVSDVYFLLKKLGFNRILVESGVKYMNEVLKNNLIKNFYLFKSSFNLNNCGQNNAKSNLIRKLKTNTQSKVKINLNGDSLYKIQL